MAAPGSASALAAAVRSGGPGRDAVADMRWALSTSPPDFLAMVSLVQRVGAPVLAVVEEQTRRTPLHVASLYAKIAYAAMLLERGADVEARDLAGWSAFSR